MHLPCGLWRHILHDISLPFAGDCQDALGMQEGGIPNNAITASSSLTSQLGPASARYITCQCRPTVCQSVRRSVGL